MPYEWVRPEAAPEESGAASPYGGPVALLRLWPHRSLPLSGFVGFFAGTAFLALLPLLLLLGTPLLWGLLPFVLGVLAALWGALRLSYRRGEVLEELSLWSDRVELVRHESHRPTRRWEANPHWVRAELHQTGGPVPNYVTLTGAGRTVEIGAFLSEEERLSLWQDLPGVLGRIGGPGQD